MLLLHTEDSFHLHSQHQTVGAAEDTLYGSDWQLRVKECYQNHMVHQEIDSQNAEKLENKLVINTVINFWKINYMFTVCI